MGLIDSYAFSNGDNSHSTSSTIDGIGQSFTGNGKRLGRVNLSLKKTGSIGGTLTCLIYAHTGTFGSTGLPTGAALATSSTITQTSINATTSNIRSFIFDGTFTPINGTKYFAVIIASAYDNAAFISALADGTSSSHGGNAARRTAGTNVWAALSNDLVFEIEDVDYRSKFLAFF